MRIASLSPAVTEILFAFELDGQIVCTDQFSNFPEAAKEIPHLKDHQKISGEDLREFSPEIVFTSTVVQEKLAEELRSQDFTVVHQDPRTITGIYDAIRSLGMLLQAEKKAQELILQMQQGFNDVKKKGRALTAAEVHEPPLRSVRLYIEEWHDPPFVSGNWVPEIARIAGGQPFDGAQGRQSSLAGELSKEVTLDDVMAFDPDLIIISWCGAGSLADKGLLEQRAGWDQLRSVCSGKIRVIDDSLLNRPGPRLVEGAQRLYSWMFEELH